MNYLKKILITLTLSSFILTLPLLHTSAKENSTPPVSPALAVITENMSMNKCGVINTPVHISKKDFEDFLLVKNLRSVTVSTLPSEFEGKLYLGNTPVVSGQTIHRADLNDLKFVPASAEIKSSSFGFFSPDSSCETSLECNLHLFSEINTAPVITKDVINGEKLTTLQNIMVFSSIKAVDNENDKMVFEITSLPQHGIATFTDSENGVFSYTPSFDYTGKDVFEYTVSDVYGNRSEKGCIEITVKKNTTETFYTDMLGREEHIDALKATEYDIMSGHLINGKMCFSPESTPTKAEFVSMVLKASGIDGKLEAVETALTDDSDIPPQLKGYVSYALNSGYISGTKTENGIFFYPNSPITRAEAAVIVNNIIDGQPQKNTVVFRDSSDIPSWAQEDIQTLAELKIIEALSDGCYSPNTNITNAQTAKMLCKLFEYNLK